MKGAEINIFDRTKEPGILFKGNNSNIVLFDPIYKRNTSLWLFCITTDRADHEEFVIADFQTELQALVNIFGFLKNHTHTHTRTCVVSSCMIFLPIIKSL